MKPSLLPTHTLLICIALLPYKGIVVAVIVWQLDLQLHMQSVSITTDFVRSNLNQEEVYNIM
jgi:hypothetical protein